MIKIWLALIVLVVADCAGTLFLARGMKQLGAVSTATLKPQALVHFFWSAVSNSSLRLGIFCMTIMFFMFISLLSWADVSFVVPATALTEPVNMLGTRFVLKEHVTPVRWFSSVLICMGIYLISYK
ncbi:EamA family transporter [Neosynechococcus sphagnicola]|uniref:EamA family transporter n=1 Tax=Neosynechococcus sphagnicola TaxID=1501145 RepID=UPI0006900D0A|nr:EamA family transporter [Neosynechococcus sphagnicola]